MPLLALIPLFVLAIIFPKMFKFFVVAPLFGVIFGVFLWCISLAFISTKTELFGILVNSSFQGFLLFWILGGITLAEIVAYLCGEE